MTLASLTFLVFLTIVMVLTFLNHNQLFLFQPKTFPEKIFPTVSNFLVSSSLDVCWDDTKDKQQVLTNELLPPDLKHKIFQFSPFRIFFF